jgi:hypothetical protein
MIRFGRKRRFRELVERQLTLFEAEHAGLLGNCEEALRAYNAAPADEAEERYGDFLDLVDTGREALEAIRDGYAETLDEPAAEEYRAVFNDLARRRLPRFALELD